MADYVFTSEIAAPQETAFDLWMNVDRMPEWTEGLTRVSDLTGLLGQAGTRYKLWFGRTGASAEILSAERPRSVTWRVRIGPLGANIAAVFEADGNLTRVTETIRTRGPLTWAWARILATGSYKGSFRGELATFARTCERDQLEPDRSAETPSS